ncbi:MAG: TIGR01212 family radical SAM protein [Lachnospiraceae bacterium]|nr:TIGR01212 family radical SAM protein [Lachnospiraceae bacterium]
MAERYNSLNNYYKSIFGKKTVRLSVDGGFTCPNRDGKISESGCIFCSEKGSGDFAGSRCVSITEQIEGQMKLLKNKWPDALYIAYFQAFTNTYAPVKKLRTIYYEALENENISGLSIATRPDCLSDECIELLKEISEKKYLSIELGLQTSNPDSARLINRGYDNKVFEEAIKKLSALNIDIVVHVIIGLPYETEEDVLNTINYINQFPIKGVKIHLLHVIKNTPLAQMYYSSYFSVLSLEDYTDIVVNAISHLRNDIVLFRLTGDGPKNLLIAPLWSRDKKKVLNTINRKLKVRNITQGQYFQK